MKNSAQSRAGLTLVEMMITTVLIGALGLIIYSLLSTGTILGAKNTAVNTAHQQARAALLQMTQTLHSAVSVPQLLYTSPTPTPVPGVIPPAEGISFQSWANGPYQIIADTTDAWQTVSISVTGTPTPPTPKVGQRLIIPGYEVESDIRAVSGAAPGNVTLTLTPPSAPSPTPVPITGTGNPTKYNIPCFITDRCSYLVNSKGALESRKPASSTTPSILATGIANLQPFTLSNGAVVIALSSFDSKSTKRGFKSSDLGLTETVPIRANLTTIP